MLILDTEYTQGGGKLSRGQRLQAGIVGFSLEGYATDGRLLSEEPWYLI